MNKLIDNTTLAIISTVTLSSAVFVGLAYGALTGAAVEGVKKSVGEWKDHVYDGFVRRGK